MDLILAAVRRGPTGKALGIDMDEEMLVTARENAAAGLGNVNVAGGFLEDLPVASSSVDWVVSNCAINLSPRKEEVFAEAARVLKPGRRLVVADIVVGDLPVWERVNESLFGGCIGSAAGDPCSRSGQLLGRLIGRSAEILAGRVRSVLFAAGKPH